MWIVGWAGENPGQSEETRGADPGNPPGTGREGKTTEEVSYIQLCNYIMQLSCVQPTKTEKICESPIKKQNKKNPEKLAGRLMTHSSQSSSILFKFPTT